MSGVLSSPATRSARKRTETNESTVNIDQLPRSNGVGVTLEAGPVIGQDGLLHPPTPSPKNNFAQLRTALASRPQIATPLNKRRANVPAAVLERRKQLATSVPYVPREEDNGDISKQQSSETNEVDRANPGALERKRKGLEPPTNHEQLSILAGAGFVSAASLSASQLADSGLHSSLRFAAMRPLKWTTAGTLRSLSASYVSSSAATACHAGSYGYSIASSHSLEADMVALNVASELLAASRYFAYPAQPWSQAMLAVTAGEAARLQARVVEEWRELTRKAEDARKAAAAAGARSMAAAASSISASYGSSLAGTGDQARSRKPSALPASMATLTASGSSSAIPTGAPVTAARGDANEAHPERDRKAAKKEKREKKERREREKEAERDRKEGQINPAAALAKRLLRQKQAAAAGKAGASEPTASISAPAAVDSADAADDPSEATTNAVMGSSASRMLAMASMPDPFSESFFGDSEAAELDAAHAGAPGWWVSDDDEGGSGKGRGGADGDGDGAVPDGETCGEPDGTDVGRSSSSAPAADDSAVAIPQLPWWWPGGPGGSRQGASAAASVAASLPYSRPQPIVPVNSKGQASLMGGTKTTSMEEAAAALLEAGGAPKGTTASAVASAAAAASTAQPRAVQELPSAASEAVAEWSRRVSGFQQALASAWAGIIAGPSTAEAGNSASGSGLPFFLLRFGADMGSGNVMIVTTAQWCRERMEREAPAPAPAMTVSASSTVPPATTAPVTSPPPAAASKPTYGRRGRAATASVGASSAVGSAGSDPFDFGSPELAQLLGPSSDDGAGSSAGAGGPSPAKRRRVGFAEASAASSSSAASGSSSSAVGAGSAADPLGAGGSSSSRQEPVAIIARSDKALRAHLRQARIPFLAPLEPELVHDAKRPPAAPKESRGSGAGAGAGGSGSGGGRDARDYDSSRGTELSRNSLLLVRGAGPVAALLRALSDSVSPTQPVRSRVKGGGLGGGGRYHRIPFMSFALPNAGGAAVRAAGAGSGYNDVPQLLSPRPFWHGSCEQLSLTVGPYTVGALVTASELVVEGPLLPGAAERIARIVAGWIQVTGDRVPAEDGHALGGPPGQKPSSRPGEPKVSAAAVAQQMRVTTASHATAALLASPVVLGTI